MRHISPSHAIKYVAGELPPAELAAIERHLDECAVCASCVEEQRALVQMLGDWHVDTQAFELADTVLSRLDAVSSQTPRRLKLYPILRIAAAVVLGVGLGYATERLALPPHAVPLSEPAAATLAPDYELLAEPDVVGLWAAYDELEPVNGEDAS